LSATSQALAKIQNQLPTTTNDAQLASMDRQAAALDSAVDRAVDQQQAELDQVEASLRKLPVRRHESVAEQRRRAPLATQQAAIKAQLAQTQALAYRADQTISAIAERRREGFSTRVLERSASPLTPAFWTSLGDAMAADIDRLQGMALRVIIPAQAAPEPKGLTSLALGLLMAIGIAIGVALLVRHSDRKRLAASSPDHTLAIVWRVGVEIAVPILSVEAIYLGAQWGGLLAPAGDQLAQAAIGSIAWAAAILALGRGLALARSPNHRVLNIGEGAAKRARGALWVVAVITGTGFFIQRLNYIMGASLASTVAADCVISLAYVAAAFLILASFGRDDAQTQTSAEAAAEVTRAPVWTLISLTLGAAIVATVGAVLLG
jgi:small-conductance mechanosensitive channel